MFGYLYLRVAEATLFLFFSFLFFINDETFINAYILFWYP